MQDDIVCVATAANATEAHQWRTALEEAGIRCRVVDHLDAEWWKGPCPRAEVWAQREDLERARAVLENHGAPAFDEREEAHARRHRNGDLGPAARRAIRRRGTDGDFRRPASRGK
jgi:hypothetical protein